MKQIQFQPLHFLLILSSIVLIPACGGGAKEKRVSRFEDRAQKAYDTALKHYSQELELADEIGLTASPGEEVQKEFAKVVKQIIIDQHKVVGIASYPYSSYYVNLRSTKNDLTKYQKKMDQLNLQLAEDIKNLLPKLEIILNQTHKAFYDELMKEQRDIDMSTEMARMSGNAFTYAGAVFGKPRL
jgi:hypothetical protein